MNPIVRHESVDCGGVKLHCAEAGDAGRPLKAWCAELVQAWSQPGALAGRLPLDRARAARSGM